MFKPIPSVEALREEIEQRHIEHVYAELALITTFAELSEVEHAMGERLGHALSIAHARKAVEGARAGIARIASAEERTKLESILLEKEAMISGSSLPNE